jgi:hypothetical protein
MSEEKIKIYSEYVPEKVCKELVELFDESTEDGGQRQYVRGEDLQCIRLNMKNMMDQKSKTPWTVYTKAFAKSMREVYSKWCEDTGTKPDARVALEVPNVDRYDPQFGIHNSTIFKKNRLLTIHFYLNTIHEKGDTVFTEFGKSVRPMMGTAIAFPATKEYNFKDHGPKDYMKYVVKGHVIKG